MTRKLSAKVGEYQKDGQTKGKYVNLGVILSGQNGDFVLLDPTVNLAGILMMQRIMNPQKAGDRVMVSIFDDSNQKSGGTRYQENNGPQGDGYGAGGRPGGGYDGDEVPFVAEVRA